MGVWLMVLRLDTETGPRDVAPREADEEQLLVMATAGDADALERLLRAEPRYNPYHGKDGKFTSSGGLYGAKGTSPNVSKTTANELAEDVRTQGGFTYDLNHKVHEDSGYSVSPYPDRSGEYPIDQFGGRHIEEYVDKNHDLLGRQDHMLGGWHDTDTGTVWLDVVVVMPEKQKAMDMGTAFNQIAIYDLAKGVEIPTGGTGRSARSLSPSRVERDVVQGGKACTECLANEDPSKVPVHPGCACNIQTNEVTLGINAEEMARLLTAHADSAMAGVALDDFPASLALDPDRAAVFRQDDFRFGDLVKWFELARSTGEYVVLLRDIAEDEAMVGVFAAMAGVGLYLYIAERSEDHDGAIIIGPDAGVEGLAEAYSLTQEA